MLATNITASVEIACIHRLTQVLIEHACSNTTKLLDTTHVLLIHYQTVRYHSCEANWGPSCRCHSCEADSRRNCPIPHMCSWFITKLSDTTHVKLIHDETVRYHSCLADSLLNCQIPWCVADSRRNCQKPLICSWFTTKLSDSMMYSWFTTKLSDTTNV